MLADVARNKVLLLDTKVDDVAAAAEADGT